MLRLFDNLTHADIAAHNLDFTSLDFTPGSLLACLDALDNPFGEQEEFPLPNEREPFDHADFV